MCILKILSEIIAILVNNAFKTVQQSAKDKEDICRRADARQRYLTQDFTLWWTGLFAVIYGIGIVWGDPCMDKYKEKAPAGELPGLSRGV